MDAIKGTNLSSEKKFGELFSASLAMMHNDCNPPLIKNSMKSQNIIIDNHDPLNLTMKKGMIKRKPLESKVKNVLKRLRVGIGNGVSEQRIVKKEKNDLSQLNHDNNLTTPQIIKNEPIHKNLLDLKVKNVIKRLRVGIIKDLNDKDPLDLSKVKTELADSRVREMIANEPLDSMVKMEFEEDSRLTVVKREPSLLDKKPTGNSSRIKNLTENESNETDLPDINIVEKEYCNEGTTLSVESNESVLDCAENKLVEKNDSDVSVVKNNVSVKNFEKTPPNNRVSDANRVANEAVENSKLDSSSISNKRSKNKTVVKKILKKSLKKFRKNETSDVNFVKNSAIESSKRNLNNYENNSVPKNKQDVTNVVNKISNKNAAEKKSEDRITRDKKVDEKKAPKKTLSNLNVTSSDLVEDNLLSNVNGLQKEVVKKKTCNEKTGKKFQDKSAKNVKVIEKKPPQKCPSSLDFSGNNLLSTAETKDKCQEKNRLVIKIVRKKGSKNNKLEVQMVKWKSHKKIKPNKRNVENIKGLSKGIEMNTQPVSSMIKNNLMDLNGKDQNLKADNNSPRIESLAASTKDKLTDNSNDSSIGESFYRPSENVMPSLIDSNENHVNPDKVANEVCELLLADLLQTEMHQSLSCIICKNNELVPITGNQNNERNDLFVCKNCENSLDVNIIKTKVDDIKNSSKCSILNVTCLKCNLSFSSEEEIELHYKTHKDNNANNFTPTEIVKPFRPQRCRECNNNNVNVLTNRLCVHFKKRRHKCEYCGKLFSTKSDLGKHINTHTREIEYTCQYCNRPFTNLSNLRKHIETHNNNRERTFKCEYCNKSFYSAYHLKVHVNVHTSEQLYECPYCDKSYTRKYCLTLHINTHTLEKLYECTICHRICMDRSTLRKHMETHSDETPYKCSYCDRLFKQKSQLMKHINNHTLEKLVFCDFCNKSFKNKTNLRKHIEIHLGNKESYLCVYCNKSYSSKANLSTHINRHTNLKSYDCTFCPKRFKDPSSLGKHTNIHTRERKYHCAHCDKIFIRKTHLRYHINSHLGIKPYKCTHCNKRFAQQSYLKVHTNNTHIGLKRFSCSICSKRFKTKINLDVHLNTHTREKLFHCSYCKKVCMQKANLKTHIFKHHADEIDDDFTI